MGSLTALPMEEKKPWPTASLLTLPQVSREVVGRLMADPAFMQKLVLEQIITISTALIYEAQVSS